MNCSREKADEQKFLGLRILGACRNELCGRYPAFGGAFANLSCKALEEPGTIGTDGESLWFWPEFLLRAYQNSPARVRRGYLHILLHCLYLHPFRRGVRDPKLWNLACDLAVELILKREEERHGSAEERPFERTEKGALLVSECEKKGNASTEKQPLEDGKRNSGEKAEKLSESAILRQRCMEEFGKEVSSADQIYGLLEQEKFSFSIEEMQEVFAFDDHRMWNHPTTEDRENLRRKWEHLLVYSVQGQEKQKRRAGQQSGYRTEAMETPERGRYDYRRFLQRFASVREEMELDTESFSYVPYLYGMEHYGNIPLIEPLEYKEVNRLEELVIAIDTSGSCSRETVQRFLEETCSIITSRENFFKKMRVYLIQCDCNIQDVKEIRSLEEWKMSSRDIRIRGRGGTDFRPVFRYVEELQRKKALKKLRALIYFTDGDGIYPQEKPPYETAFVFLKKTEAMNLAPPWALRLTVEI